MAEFTKPLRRTSPLTRGKNVEDAQYLLAGHNRFPGLAPYKDGEIDGVYGDVTAIATARAKFWLGYPDNAINKAFGQTLYEYLRVNHWRPLPEDYRARRQKRIAAAQLTTGQKALNEAIKHLGTKESPFGSNRTPFGKQYGMDGEPWCAIFDSCMFHDSGYVTKSGIWRFRYSYVPDIHQDARLGRNNLRLVWTPKAGDLALFDLHGERDAHVAFVREPPKAGFFVDLGGNTGPTDISNGGAVLSQRRATSLVDAWVRVDG